MPDSGKYLPIMLNLNQVTVPSLDVAQSVVFYQSLGLRLIVDAQPRYVRFECLEGDSTLSVHRVEEIQEGEGIALYFEIESLDDFVSELQNKGTEFDQLPTDQPWLWREAHLRDPDGNKIILFYGGNNRKNPPWRIKPKAT